MSEGRRVQKVEKEMKQVIANYIHCGGYKGPVRGIISVTRVIAARDLRSAKVYIGVMGSEDDQFVTIDGLADFARDIQSEVNKRMPMKFCPKLKFFYDDTSDKVMEVDALLHDIEVQREKKSEDSEEN